jgi:hypothetical protein
MVQLTSAISRLGPGSKRRAGFRLCWWSSILIIVRFFVLMNVLDGGPQLLLDCLVDHDSNSLVTLIKGLDGGLQLLDLLLAG